MTALIERSTARNTTRIAKLTPTDQDSQRTSDALLLKLQPLGDLEVNMCCIRLSSVLGAFLAACNTSTAQCILPYQLANGQEADATQVMANYNALLDCVENAAPGGATNAIQYNAGSGTFAGVGPLTDGQLVIGSTGNSPQANTLTAGPGIAITNGPGNITIEATSAAVGLYHQVLSAVPTISSTGLSTWLNQGAATVTDSVTGLSVDAPAASVNMRGRYKAAPTPPYKITALIGATRNSSSYSSVSIGWYDGTNKLHLLEYNLAGGGVPRLYIQKWNSPTSWNGDNFVSAVNGFAQPIWFQIEDDGTNVSFGFSQDGANFLEVFSTPKSSAFLGAAGYSNIIFTVDAQGGRTIGTLMSWTEN